MPPMVAAETTIATTSRSATQVAEDIQRAVGDSASARGTLSLGINQQSSPTLLPPQHPIPSPSGHG